MTGRHWCCDSWCYDSWCCGWVKDRVLSGWTPYQFRSPARRCVRWPPLVRNWPSGPTDFYQGTHLQMFHHWKKSWKYWHKEIQGNKHHNGWFFFPWLIYLFRTLELLLCMVDDALTCLDRLFAGSDVLVDGWRRFEAVVGEPWATADAALACWTRAILRLKAREVDGRIPPKLLVTTFLSETDIKGRKLR